METWGWVQEMGTRYGPQCHRNPFDIYIIVALNKNNSYVAKIFVSRFRATVDSQNIV